MPDATFTIDVFAVATCNPSGHGQAERWLGELEVTTDGDGHAAFEATFPEATPPGQFVTATGSRVPKGWTSELSACTTITTE